MEPVMSDVDCLARSLSEPEAFVLIFERHFDAIHTYLQRRVGRDLADDLAAETFACAFERRAGCRAEDGALPWLLRNFLSAASSAAKAAASPIFLFAGRAAISPSSDHGYCAPALKTGTQ